MSDWIGEHVHSFSYLRSVPAIVVPDNIESGVRLAHRYEPQLNPTYAAMAPHQEGAIVLTRSAEPRDIK